MATITLSKNIDILPDSRYALKIWVSSTTNNIPSEIFLYLATSPVPPDGVLRVFQKVCSYADMLEYPVNDPDTTTPFYRFSGVYREYASYKELNDFWTTTQTNVQTLINEIVDTNLANATQTINTFP